MRGLPFVRLEYPTGTAVEDTTCTAVVDYTSIPQNSKGYLPFYTTGTSTIMYFTLYYSCMVTCKVHSPVLVVLSVDLYRYSTY